MRVGMEMGRYWLQTAQGYRAAIAVVLSGRACGPERSSAPRVERAAAGGLAYTVIFGLTVYWLLARA